MALPPSMNDESLFYTDDMILPSTSYSLSGLPLSDEPLPLQSFLPMDDGSQVDSTAWDGSMPDLSTTSHPLTDVWSFDMMSMNNNMPSLEATSGYESVPSSGEVTGPPTPDLLPMQPEPETQDDEDELVGMGLYNQPESFHDGVLGKGLKLEETFTPSSPNENKDGEDDEQEQNDDQPAQRSPQHHPHHYEPVKQPAKPAMELLSQSFLFDDDSSFDQHIITDTQPFFPLDQSCMNYGYGWI